MRILLIGLVYVFIGCHQIARYDKAEPSDSSIDAQIVDAQIDNSSDIIEENDQQLDNDVSVQPICGNDKIEEGEECDGEICCTLSCTFASSQTLCRPSAGTCDEEEKCSGTRATCPSDTFKVDTVVCRPSAGTCDEEEKCSGTSANCPADEYMSSSTSCRAPVDNCDREEFCTGSSLNCPLDTFHSSTEICRQSSGECDVKESCTGSSTACPIDSHLNNGTRCNSGLGHCLNGSCQSLPQTSSIILHLPLDGNATSIKGTYTITDTNNDYRPDGKINESAYFDGSHDEYIDIPNLDFSGSYTISVWAKRNPAIQNYARLFETGDGWDSSRSNIDGLDLHLTVQTPRVFYLFTPNDCGTADFQDQNDSQWYHYVITFDSSTKDIKSYLDGSSSDTVNCSILGPHQGLSLGANATGSSNFFGYIDELIVWNNVLTEAEVQTLYASQK